jgi:hypothetical protein
MNALSLSSPSPVDTAGTGRRENKRFPFSGHGGAASAEQGQSIVRASWRWTVWVVSKGAADWWSKWLGSHHVGLNQVGLVIAAVLQTFEESKRRKSSRDGSGKRSLGFPAGMDRVEMAERAGFKSDSRVEVIHDQPVLPARRRTPPPDSASRVAARGRAVTVAR